jgi:DNA repair protein RadC
VSVWSGLSDDLPRERVLRRGAKRMSDVELVALVLRTGRSGQNALELAQALLDRYGGLGGVAVAPADVLSAHAGMGPAKGAAIAAAFELGRRTTEQAEAVPIRRAEDVVAVARREARGVRRDEVVAYVTDDANRVRWAVGVAVGAVSRATAPVRRIAEAVLAHHGAGFAVARLSTAAVAEALPVDHEMVRRLRAVALYADIRFLDYVVVADTAWCGVLTGGPVEGVASPPLPGGLTGPRPAPYDIRAGP